MAGIAPNSSVLKKVRGISQGAEAGSSLGIPGMIAGGLGALHPGSPLGNAVGLVNTGQKIGSSFSGSPDTPQTDQNMQSPVIGSQFQGQSASIADPSSAVGRALSNKQSDPSYKIDQGLQLLNDPDVVNGLPHHVYMGAAESLLRAKHFGQGGGYDQSPQQYTFSGNQQMDNGGSE